MVERAWAGEAIELRRGWRYLSLTPFDGEVFDESVLAGLAWFVGRVLGGHPHTFSRFGESAVVAIGPPDATTQERRLSRALREELAAEVGNDDGSVLN